MAGDVVNEEPEAERLASIEGQLVSLRASVDSVQSAMGYLTGKIIEIEQRFADDKLKINVLEINAVGLIRRCELLEEFRSTLLDLIAKEIARVYGEPKPDIKLVQPEPQTTEKESG
jgi:hypothetical protein